MTNKAKIGASIVLDGEKEFKSAVTACSKKLATMRSELGLVKEKYAENANSLTALQDKHKVLSNIEQLKANRAVQQNEKYMHEAENATDAKVRYKGKVGHVNKKFIE